MHDWYDWLKDIGLPALVGLGSIGVGAVAVVVARQSHELAKQVRRDEAKRDEEAARARYRDQLFRTIEPAVSALLQHRRLIAEHVNPLPNTPVAAAPSANVMSALNLVDAVANAEDQRMLGATISAYDEALRRKNFKVMSYVLGALALGLARLLAEDRDIDGLVSKTEGIVEEAVREIAAASK